LPADLYETWFWGSRSLRPNLLVILLWLALKIQRCSLGLITVDDVSMATKERWSWCCDATGLRPTNTDGWLTY
jgi:hypothetical protein